MKAAPLKEHILCNLPTILFVHGISSFTMQSIRKNSFQKLTHITSIYPPTDISVDGCVNFEIFFENGVI